VPRLAANQPGVPAAIPPGVLAAIPPEALVPPAERLGTTGLNDPAGHPVYGLWWSMS